MRLRTTLVPLMLLLLLPACSREVARVGPVSISRQDIERRTAVSSIQYPGSGQPVVGLTQLIKGYLAVEVMRSLGHPLSDAALEAESVRIDTNTKAPDLLGRIKAVYGSDRRAYLDTYVRIVLAERLLYGEIFPALPEVQRDRRRTAEEFLAAAVKAPSDFIPLAQKAGLTPNRFYVSERTGVMLYEEHAVRSRSGQPEDGAAQHAAWLLALLQKLKPGMVYPEIIEGQEGYEVLRAERREGGGMVIVSASIPKRTYDDWFWEQAKKVPVKVHDRQLKQEFLSKVSWAKLVSLD